MKAFIEQLQRTAAIDAAKLQGEEQPRTLSKVKELLDMYPSKQNAREMFIILASVITYNSNNLVISDALSLVSLIMEDRKKSDVFRVINENF
jgi:hypothetical protein